jgi:hypothetical protein
MQRSTNWEGNALSRFFKPGLYFGAENGGTKGEGSQMAVARVKPSE